MIEQFHERHNVQVMLWHLKLDTMVENKKKKTGNCLMASKRRERGERAAIEFNKSILILYSLVKCDWKYRVDCTYGFGSFFFSSILSIALYSVCTFNEWLRLTYCILAHSWTHSKYKKSNHRNGCCCCCCSENCDKFQVKSSSHRRKRNI